MSELQITDQLGRQISLTKVPEKIISLVPSITFLLFKLDLEQSIKGITRFCKLPPHFKKHKVNIGGTKEVKFDRIAGLKPDLILANKEENTKEIVSELQKIAPVYVSDVADLIQNERLIVDLGMIFNRQQAAQKLIQTIQSGKSERYYAGGSLLKAAYIIWKNPWMTVGGDTFINEMMQLAGFQNVFADKKRYPKFELNALHDLKPDVILLCSEPFPFKENEKSVLQKQFPDTCILLVSAEPFTWFGAYPAEAFSYFNSLQKQIDACIPKMKN